MCPVSGHGAVGQRQRAGVGNATAASWVCSPASGHRETTELRGHILCHGEDQVIIERVDMFAAANAEKRQAAAGGAGALGGSVQLPPAQPGESAADRLFRAAAGGDGLVSRSDAELSRVRSCPRPRAVAARRSVAAAMQARRVTRGGGTLAAHKRLAAKTSHNSS